MSKTGMLRRLVKGLAWLAVFGVVAVAALLGSLALEHRRDTVLPAPTGPLAVGRAIEVWTDTAIDPGAPEPGASRELVAWMWYPAVARHSPPIVDDYLPSAWREAIEHQRPALINRLLTRDLSRVRAHSLRDAEVSPQAPSYPVVIMMGAFNFTTLAEDLASHGYVVVSVDVPHRSGIVVFPDGRVIERAAQNDPDLVAGPERKQLANMLVGAASTDLGFALDQLGRLNASDPSGRFTGRLDLQRVGAFGHSLGGAIALQFCHDDRRCKAGVDVDGAPHGTAVADGVTQPFMFLLSDHSGESDPESSRIVADIRSIHDRLPANGRLQVTIRGANHYSFSDDGAMLKSQLVRGALRAVGLIGIDGRRQVVITAHYISRFFDVHLKGAPASSLMIASPLYPEVQILE